MRKIWSEANKRRLWRNLWVVLAEVQSEFGLVRQEQVADLRAHMDEIDVHKSLQREGEIHHDLMAELNVFADQSPLGGGILHLGATSADIEDNADVLRVRLSIDLLLNELRSLLLEFATKIDTCAQTALIAFTHLQPAEPSTLGYRFCTYAQDLLIDWQNLTDIRSNLRAKGFKGAVGTSASYAALLGEGNLIRFEEMLSERLNLSFFDITTQVYPRKQDYQVVSALAGLGASLYRFAFDLRILQSPPLGELSEPFATKQVGSSAMPFKRNPINAEKIDSLARVLATMPRLAWDNAAHSLLERTLDDSANRRTLLPEAFLITDELLRTSVRIIRDLQINESAIEHNLATYAPFAAVEPVLMALVKAGANRQDMHARLRDHAMQAWSAIQKGQANPLMELIAKDPEIINYLSELNLRKLIGAKYHLGDAARRARSFSRNIYQCLKTAPA